MKTLSIFIAVLCTYALAFVTETTAFARTRRRTKNAQCSSHYMPTTTSLAVASTLSSPSSLASLNSETDKIKVGILLLNLGGPETTVDVEGFLYNLFNDPDIIRLPPLLAPLQPLLAYVIAKRRAPKSRAAYDSIGGGSPILKYSRAQGQLVCDKLREQHSDWMDPNYYLGMRYWHPMTEVALDQAVKDGVQALVVVPLYPQFSISTTGSSLRVLQKEFSTKYQHLTHTVICQWHLRPGYIKAMADMILYELEQYTPEQLAEAKVAAPELPTRHVLFSAHGVPLSYIENAGDPYQKQIVECVAAISELLPKEVQVHLSYQSRVGPIEWLRPYTDDVLPELGDKGVKNLVVVPISFVSEHIETLEEIDIEYRELAEEHGVSNWRRCPALNTNPDFIQDMANMVVDALTEPMQTVTEACVANTVQVFLDDDPMVDETFGFAGVQGVGSAAALYERSVAKESDKEGLMQTERWYARVAMASAFVALLVELLNGKSLVQMFGGS
ncbi:hypothetical protein MPSEU_000161100 [Mayamaea pseudoterrestris]|nr:hypothetical protein MPSEU_000161100 [Mayamaea pseudoterrestris]